MSQVTTVITAVRALVAATTVEVSLAASSSSV